MARKYLTDPLILIILIIFTIAFSHKLLSQEAEIISGKEQVFKLIDQAKSALVGHQIDIALNCYEEALWHRDAQSDHLLKIAIYNLMGLAFELDGQFQEALAHFERGLILLRRLNNEKISTALDLILDRLTETRKVYVENPGAAISAALYRGEIDNLKQFFNQEQTLVQPKLAIFLLINDGNMYLQQSQFDAADTLYIVAVLIAKEYRLSTRVQQLYSNLTWSALKQNHFGKANVWLDSLKKFSPSLLSTVDLRNALLAQGLIKRNQKQYQPAIADIEQAISFYQQTNDNRGLCRALAHLANTYLFIKDFENAKINYLKALELNQSVKDIEAAWFANGGLAKYYYHLKNYEQALEHFKAYFEIIEKITNSFLTDEGKTSFLGSQNEMMSAYATTAIAVAQQQQKFDIARPIIEKLRAQTLKDLQETRGRREQAEVGHLSAGYVLFHDRSEEWEKVRSELGAVGFLSRDSQPDISRQKLLGVFSMPERGSEREELSLEEIPKATFLEYYTLPEQIVIFVKSADGKINGAVTEINADSQEKLITEYCFTLEIEDTRGMTISRQVVPIASNRALSTKRTASELSKLLYQLLITPVEKYLAEASGQSIVIVPHRWLWQLPFAALQNAQNNYFGDQYTLSYAASNESWNLIAKKPRPADHRDPNAWIVGNPHMPEKIDLFGTGLSFQPLPGAEIEALEIAKLFGEGKASIFTGHQADRLRLETWHPNFSVLHLATHGFACPEHPLSSFIVLSALDEGELKIDTTSFEISLTNDPRFAVKLDTLQEMTDYTWAWWDIANPTFPGILNALMIIDRFRLNADLVTLSACQTGIGKILGEGNIGFSRAFLKAGARSLLVSLWRVDDEATRDLMVAFYSEYLKHGNKALALQKAMQQTRERFPHPKYWAAFTLIGLAE